MPGLQQSAVGGGTSAPMANGAAGARFSRPAGISKIDLLTVWGGQAPATASGARGAQGWSTDRCFLLVD